MVYDVRLKMTVSTLLLLFAFFCLASPGTIQENGPGVVRVVVKEGSDAVLPCSLSTKEDIALSLFDWKKDNEKEVFLYQAGLHYNNGRQGQDEKFKGRVFHFPEELKNGNASIIIRNTTKFDSGNYTCDFPHLQPNGQMFNIELVVREAAKPSPTVIGTIKDGLLLQCEVRGASPKPEVEWLDSSGNILPAEESQVIIRGDHYDVTLITTVTKTDRFRCVVKQQEIDHMIDSEIYVPFFEKRCDVLVGWLCGLTLGAAIPALLLALLVLTKCITISRNKGSSPQMNGSCNGALHVPLKTQSEP